MADDLGHLAADSGHMAGDSGRMAGDSGHIARDSGHIDEDSGHLPVDSGRLTEETALQLRQLAGSVAVRRRVDRAEMMATICDLCEGRFLTSSQLADLLGRSPEGLRKRFLTPMVREGLLMQKYPAATNRPDQAYTTVGER